MGRRKNIAAEENNIDNADSFVMDGFVLPTHRLSDQRVRNFLKEFSEQSEDVRNTIVRELPAYNSLLSLKATSFKEIYLRQVASDRGEFFDSSNPPLPPCPLCGHTHVGRKKRKSEEKEDAYRCFDCKKVFSANYGSIAYNSNCDILTWMKVFHSLINFTPITRACEYCGIAPETYYSLRQKIFYSIELFLNDLKLFGDVEVDNTFVKVSYKGLDLQIYDAPEGSIFEDQEFKPRASRNRGGAYAMAEKNANSLCLYSAIDDRGHVIVRVVGLGQTNYRNLRDNIPASCYLSEVPKEDPFGKFMKKQRQQPKTKHGEATWLIADKEGAIKKYAEEYLHLDIETHVYHADGKQRSFGRDWKNIQRCNALHSRLKRFLRNCNYVSSKYLPGYLLLFCFLENTGGSDHAVYELFRIIATPNLSKPPEFYKELYQVPNYLLSWFNDDHPLRKIPNNKILAFYLYDHMKHPEDYPGAKITMDYIVNQVHLTAPTIRNSYHSLYKAGYRDMILEFCGEPPRKKPEASKTINPTVLAIYQEYAKIRLLPKSERQPFQQFLDEKNKQYGTAYTRTNMLAKFKYIEENGFLEELPDLNRDKVTYGDKSLPAKAFKMLERYDEIRIGYMREGKKPPKNQVIYNQLSVEFGKKPSYIAFQVNGARSHLNKQKKPDEY